MGSEPIVTNVWVQAGFAGLSFLGMVVIIVALWRWSMSLLKDAATERKEQRDVDKETTAAINKLSAVIEAGQRGART